MKHNTYNMLYTHDGNKNVSEVLFANLINGIGAHYEYAPFGVITRTSKSTPISTVDFIELNPFRFSSEFHDQELGLVYYNYRHYNPTDGRWLSRDPIEEQGGLNLYAASKNDFVNSIDSLGFSNDVEILEKFMKWYAQEENKLHERDSEGKNWVDRLKKSPEKLVCKCIIVRNKTVGIAHPYPVTCSNTYSKFVCSNPDPNEWDFSQFFFGMVNLFGTIFGSGAYHPGGEYELRTKTPAKYNGNGNQCIYDKCGKLVTSIPSAGTADFASPNESVISFRHYTEDVVPFGWAQQLDKNLAEMKYVKMYYKVRPSK